VTGFCVPVFSRTTCVCFFCLVGVRCKRTAFVGVRHFVGWGVVLVTLWGVCVCVWSFCVVVSCLWFAGGTFVVRFGVVGGCLCVGCPPRDRI